MDNASAIATLGRTELLGELTPQELASLASLCKRREYSAGEMIFAEGEPCRGLQIVARGRVRIYKSSAAGREQVLAINGAGESIAELPVFDAGSYPASALALEATEILFIDAGKFHAHCLANPEIALKVLAVVGKRLRSLVGIIEELSFTTVRQRLAAALLALAEKEGRREGDALIFQLPASHQELAHRLGTVRELVSRNLARLQAEGILSVDARRIALRDVAALKAILRPEE